MCATMLLIDDIEVDMRIQASDAPARHMMARYACQYAMR